jgi:hypothetical protein
MCYPGNCAISARKRNMLDEITSVLLESVKIANEFRPADQQISIDTSTLLVGKGSRLESMDLVNLLVSAEAALVAKGYQLPDLIELVVSLNDSFSSLSVAQLAQHLDDASVRNA